MRLTNRLMMLTAIAGLALAAIAEPPTTEPATTEPAQPALAAPEIGKPAPVFELKDTAGKTVTLASLKGRVVVLSWLHPACEEARDQYLHGTMDELQRMMEDEDIRWLVINPLPAADPNGGAAASEKAARQLGIRSPLLLDETQKTTKAYAVTRSPCVAVIDDEGILRYMGAIDNAPNAVVPEGEKKVSFLEKALVAVLDGATVAPTKVEAKGCDIFKPSGPG